MPGSEEIRIEESTPSVIAGVSFVRFHFRFFAGSIKAPQIVEFMRALKATISRKLLIVWD